MFLMIVRKDVRDRVPEAEASSAGEAGGMTGVPVDLQTGVHRGTQTVHRGTQTVHRGVRTGVPVSLQTGVRRGTQTVRPTGIPARAPISSQPDVRIIGTGGRRITRAVPGSEQEEQSLNDSAGSADLLSHIEDILRENEKYTKMLLRERNVNKLISNIELAGEVGDVRALYPVLDVLSLTSNKRVIATALNTLGKLGDITIIPVMAEYLYDDNSRVRANAVEALGRMGHPKIVRLVVPFLKDPDNRVRANAAKALWKFGREEIISTLKGMLGSGSPRMRASAVYALTEMGDETVIPLVKRGLKDPDKRVREVAARCLKQLEKKFRTRDALVARYGRKGMPSTPGHGAEQLSSGPIAVESLAEPAPEVEMAEPIPVEIARPAVEPVKPEKIEPPEIDLPKKTAEPTVEEAEISLIPSVTSAEPVAKESASGEWNELMEMVSKAEARVKQREESASRVDTFVIDEPDLADLAELEFPETDRPEPPVDDIDFSDLERVMTEGMAAAPVQAAPEQAVPATPASPVVPPAVKAEEEVAFPDLEVLPEKPPEKETATGAEAPATGAEAPHPEPQPIPAAEEPDDDHDGIPLEPKLLERLAEIDMLVQDAAEFMAKVSDEENTVRKVNVIEMAGKVGDPKALLPILDLLQVEKNERVIAVGLKAVGSMGDEAVVPFLMEYVSHSSARIRVAALEALDTITHPSGIRGIIPLLIDSNVMVRAKAAKAIWQFEKDDIIDVLETIVEDGTKDEKFASLHALEKMGGERTTGLLEQLQQCGDTMVEREARSVLARVKQDQERKDRYQKPVAAGPAAAPIAADSAAPAAAKPAKTMVKKTRPAARQTPVSAAAVQTAAQPYSSAAQTAPAPITSAKSGGYLKGLFKWIVIGVGGGLLIAVLLIIGVNIKDAIFPDQPSRSRDRDRDVTETRDSGTGTSSPTRTTGRDREINKLVERLKPFMKGAAFAVGEVTRDGKRIRIIGKKLESDDKVNVFLDQLPRETVIIIPKPGGVIMVHGEKIGLAKRFLGKDVLLISSDAGGSSIAAGDTSHTGSSTRPDPSTPSTGSTSDGPSSMSGSDINIEMSMFYGSLIKAWNERDLDALMRHYSRRFSGQGNDFDSMKDSYLTEFEIAGDIKMHMLNEKNQKSGDSIKHTATFYFEGASADGFQADKENTLTRRMDTLKRENNDWRIVESEDILE